MATPEKRHLRQPNFVLEKALAKVPFLRALGFTYLILASIALKGPFSLPEAPHLHLRPQPPLASHSTFWSKLQLGLAPLLTDFDPAFQQGGALFLKTLSTKNAGSKCVGGERSSPTALLTNRPAATPKTVAASSADAGLFFKAKVALRRRGCGRGGRCNFGRRARRWYARRSARGSTRR